MTIQLSQETEERLERSRRRYLRVVVAVVVLTALLVGWSTLSLQQLANQNRGTQRSSAATVQRIEDCTTPGKACFDEAASRQAAVIGRPAGPINEVVVLAAACARQPSNDTEAEIRACVEEGLTSR